MIKKIKSKIAHINLNRQLSEQVRQKEFINLEDARSIGIVFDATNPDDFEIVKKYVLGLKERGKKVHAIGYFDQKHSPTHLSYPKTEFDFFNARELKGLYQPASPYIQTFISEIRDLLIDFNLKNKFPLRYIAARSFARCKVGIAIPENNNIHDVLIALNPDAGAGAYIRQLEVYLNMLNSGEG